MNLDKIEKILKNLCSKALKKGEMPVGAVLVNKDGKIIAKSYNKKNIKKNVIYHAEILCISKASRKLKNWNLNGCTLYVSLEPCNMCKEVISEARIDNVFYILNKGKITNKYKKTKYKQMYVINIDFFNNYIKIFFNSIRK